MHVGCAWNKGNGFHTLASFLKSWPAGGQLSPLRHGAFAVTSTEESAGGNPQFGFDITRD
jgi:hypothetical protein